SSAGSKIDTRSIAPAGRSRTTRTVGPSAHSTSSTSSSARAGTAAGPGSRTSCGSRSWGSRDGRARGLRPRPDPPLRRYLRVLSVAAHEGGTMLGHRRGRHRAASTRLAHRLGHLVGMGAKVALWIVGAVVWFLLVIAAWAYLFQLALDRYQGKH